MKLARTILAVMATVIITSAFSPDEKYYIDMRSHIAELNQADSESELEGVIERIDAIRQVVPDEWIPAYYIATAKLKLADMKDDLEASEKLFDEATTLINNAIDQWPSESELKVFLANIYIQKSLGKEQGQMERMMGTAQSLLEDAIAHSPDNPRAYFLMGKSIFELSRLQGDHSSESCEYFTMAEDKFSVFRPESELHPLWGRDDNARMTARCTEKADPEGQKK